MNRSLCSGPLFLFLPLLSGGVLSYFVAILLHPWLGVLTWYYFLILFLLCSLLSLFGVGLLGCFFNARNRTKGPQE